MITIEGTMALIKRFTGVNVYLHKDMLEVEVDVGSLTSYQQKLLLRCRVRRIEYLYGSYWIWLN